MTKRFRMTLLAIILFLLALIALLFTRCTKPAAPKTVATASTPAPTTAATPETPKAATPAAAEVLTAATIDAPASVVAGAPFKLTYTGPDNRGDYVTLVKPDVNNASYGNYADVRPDHSLELHAPVDAGDYELRYVTGQSKTILGRRPIVIAPAEVTLKGPDQAILGTNISIEWTGPNNPGDYITVVAKDLPDGRYSAYAVTSKGSPLTVTLPVDAGDAEIRYMTGQGAKVIGRRDIKILTPDVSLTAPARVDAGTIFEVSWTGPNNAGDYVTIVPKDMPDGRYANYSETSKGPKLKITALITPGPAELRYMTGSGARVLARRAIEITAAEISLEAPAEVPAGAAVQITWKGPSNHGDYITIVPASLPDGQYARYADTSKGSPMTVESPIDPGAAEIRYMSGQGAKVLARRAIRTLPVEITFDAPARAKVGSSISIKWTGPKNPGDNLTVVMTSAKDGAALHTALAARGSPSAITVPAEAGLAEIRYMSGQGNRVLARTAIELVAE